MGFKCPKCKKDFGTDINELSRHFLNSPICALSASIINSKIQEVVELMEKTNNEQ